MSFSINLGDWGSVFVVPTSIVDKHIKLAGAAQLKVLLWILRNSGKDFTIDDIAKALSMHPADVKDAVQYWVETKVIAKREDGLYPCDSNFNEKECDKTKEIGDSQKKELLNPKPQPVISRPQKPDMESVAKRISENSSVASLMQEAQVVLGRTITNGDCSTLLMLHDYYGLPIDVIIMVLQYASSVGKTNMKYIEKVAISWISDGIDTLQKAENKIKELDQKNRAWRKVENIVGIEHRSPTAKEAEMTNRWVNEWGYSSEMIREAYERCVDARGKYIATYIDTIIKRWHSLKITTIAQAIDEKGKQQYSSANEKTAKSKSTASYDIDEYEKSSIFDD